jgi:uncharacterized protein YkwD
MTRVRIVAALCALAALLALPSAAPASTPAITMLQKVNAFRAQNGLPPVHLSRSLVHSATAYSHHMMSSGYFGHASRIHASRRFRTLGEIIEIHTGSRPNIGLTFSDWVHSGPHRSVMLYRAFRYAGAGYVTGRFRGHKATIWTMHFGR